MLLQEECFFLRTALQQLLESSYLEGQAAEPSAFFHEHFFQEINDFFCRHATITLKLPALYSPKNFGLLLVEWINGLNHYPNPLNRQRPEMSEEQEAAFHHEMARFFEIIGNFLHQLQLPISRKGQEVYLSPHKTEVEIWKKSLGVNDQLSLERVSAIDFNSSRKVIICCGGTAQIHGFSVAGFINMAEERLGGIEVYEKKGVDIYAITYPILHRAHFFADTHRYNAAVDTYIAPYAQNFFNGAILPFLENFTTKGGDAIKQAAAQLNFFAYSYGTVFVRQLQNALWAWLVAQSIDREMIKDILAEVYSLNIGATCRLNRSIQRGCFSSVYLLFADDLSMRSKTENWRLKSNNNSPAKETKVLNDHELVVFTEAKPITIIQQSHNNIDGNNQGTTKIIKPSHQLSYYMHQEFISAETMLNPNPSRRIIV
ncbi:MAG: hypothetical protein ACOYK8_00885 [Alphaproteobacteria bacterium]